MAGPPLKCLVEIPKGSRNKYEYDHEHDVIKLDRFLFSSMVYPTDYGFIPDTLGLDGDPLDAMVCVSEPTFPGCMIEVKPIALFRMEDDKGIDDKVLCVPLNDPSWNTLEELDDISKRKDVLIGFHYFAQSKAMTTVNRPIQAWYVTRTRDTTGNRWIELANPCPINSFGKPPRNFESMRGPTAFSNFRESPDC